MQASGNRLFNADTPNVYTMPSGASFLKQLAIGLKASLGDELATAMILLPTRRSVRELTDVFLDLSGGRATVLPLMRTLADMDENEPPFVLGAVDIDVPQSIESARHSFELAQLIVRKMKASGEPIDAASALAMSEPLASLLSDVSMEELDANAFANLDDDLELLPAHFQSAAEFVQIVTRHWPAYLAELGLSEPSARRVALLNAAAKLWQDTPPNHPVVIAGSTGTLAATGRLIKSVASMAKGLVVLPGLDINIDDVVWDNIDDQHPQASLKNILGTLGLDRKKVPEWPQVSLPRKARMRARILAESLIPADSTADWPERIASIKTSDSGEDSLRSGFDGLSLIEAKTEEEEASIIALIMRETLEDIGKTCALITPDPALARRVRAKLTRWDIDVDNSAGEPLEETLHGSFLALSAQVALDPFDPIAMSALVKHTLYAHISASYTDWHAFEKRALRGTRPRSLDAITKRLRGHCAAGLEIWTSVFNAAQPLHNAMQKPCDSGAVARLHAQFIETLAQGANNVWRGESGEKAASLMEELMDYGALLPDVKGRSYIRLLSMMMRGRVVRPRYGTEKRLHILGPLEARMLEADQFILGGLNEGVWPAPPAPHPVLSRGMRLKIGLTAPERRFGLAAHDFAQLAAKPNVILTRSQRTGDGPGVQSRWLWRLTTLARGAQEKNILNTSDHYLDWARALDVAPEKPSPASRPAPKPPLAARWPKARRLSVTQIQKWIRDPYSIYADKVLQLRPLDGLDQALGGREYGSAVHKALETLDELNEEQLAAALAKELRAAGFEDHSFSRHTPRLKKMAAWLMLWAQERRAKGWDVRDIEIKGEMQIDTGAEPFTLSGVADRLEQRGTEIAIMDYKTGAFPSRNVVQAGFDPQLPLLAVMLSAGKLGREGRAADLLYVNPKAQKEYNLLDKEYDAQAYEEEALEELKKLIAHFDNENSAYYSQPRAQHVNPYGDYDHLARRSEWATLGNDGGKND